MIIEKKKIRHILFGFIFAFSVLRIAYLDIFSTYYISIRVCQIILCTYVILVRCTINRRKSVFKVIPLYLLLIFEAILIIPVIDVKRELISALLFCLGMLSIFLLFNVEDYDCFTGTLSGVKLFYILIVFIQILSIIFFQEGLYHPYGKIGRKYYFLGHVNNTSRYIVPCLCIMMFLDIEKKNKIGLMSWIMSFISLVGLVICRSWTGFVSVLVFEVYMLLYTWRSRFLYVLTGVKGVVVSFIIFVLLTNQYIVNAIYYFAGYLNRSASFKTRLEIWELSWKWVSKNIITGYGYIHNYAKYLMVSNYYHPSSAHNFFLDLLMNSGAVGLAIFLTMLIICTRKLDAAKKDSKYALIAVIWAYGIGWNFDPYFNAISMNGFFILLSIMYFGTQTFKCKKDVTR